MLPQQYLPKTPALVDGMQICTHCQQTIEKYEADPIKSKWEQKWSQHWTCRDQIFNMLTRMTPGR